MWDPFLMKKLLKSVIYGIREQCMVELSTIVGWTQKKKKKAKCATVKHGLGIIYIQTPPKFKASKQYTDLLDANYATGFEDFRMDAMENFPEVDFSSIKLNLATATSSLLQTSSEDVNVEDDASTQPPQDDPNANAPSS